MATVYIDTRIGKNGKKSHQVKYKDPVTGKNKHYKTFRLLADAKTAERHLRDLIDKGKMSEVKVSSRKMALQTFSEIAASLVSEWVIRHERKEIAAKTLKNYQDRITVLNRVFGDSLLCEISRQEIMNYQTRTMKIQSVVTSNRNMFVLKQIFKHGEVLHAISENHAANIRYLNERGSERTRFLLPHEIETLVTASQKTRAKFYMPVLIYLGAEHGASKQECLDLKWTDINFDFRPKGKIYLFRTKNKGKRWVDIMPRTREALLAWRDHLIHARYRRRMGKVKMDLVFCHLDGSPIDGFKKAWEATKKKANIEDFHFHDMRHTFCSNLILAGADLKTVKEMIGHRDISMTDRYTHLTQGYQSMIQEKLAEHYAADSVICATLQR
jgi:site-specific recombinase XerD